MDLSQQYSSADRTTSKSDMISKLVILGAMVALVASQADRYPAGVPPSFCPAYPICDNALLAAHSQGAGAPIYAHAPAISSYGYASGLPAGVPGGPGVPGLGAGAQYPAGVSPAACPNYPFCSGHVGAYAAAAPPLPGFATRLYPDGVSAHQCPNYPYC